MRRWKDLFAAHLNDLGGEGLSEGQISVCRRISTMEVELESLEAKIAKGKIIDPDLYGRLCGRLARMLELIGVRRLVKPLDPATELARALEAYPTTPVDEDDGDEPLLIEEGFDKSDPGEA